MDKDALKWGPKLVLIGTINISVWFVFIGIPYHFRVAGILFCLGGVLFFYDAVVGLRGKFIYSTVVFLLLLTLIHGLSLYFIAVQSSQLFGREFYLISNSVLLAVPVLFCWTMLNISSHLNLDVVKPIWKNALRIAAGIYLLPAILNIIGVIALMLGVIEDFGLELGVSGEITESNVIIYWIARCLFLVPIGYVNYVLMQTVRVQQPLAP